MRPATPNFNFTQQAGPSSPPQTPTTTTSSSAYAFGKSRRHGQVFTGQHIPAHHGNGGIIPNGPGNSFSYIPSPRAADLSPRSSTPDSVQSSASGSPPRSEASSSPAPRRASTPPRKRAIRVGEGSFTIDEFQESDYEDFDSDADSVIRPHEYEDAASDRGSVKGPELDQNLYSGIQNLRCENENEAVIDPEPDLETQREAWLEKVRAEKRRKRRSSGSVQKRTLSQSIGSDTDDEDIQPATFEGATSARRLRRKVESLIFDDPPPRIEELEEPESCEEVVDVEGDVLPDGFRELPYFYYVQEDMDLDSDEE